MKAAVVHGPGQAPVYDDFAEPQAAAGEARITVHAAALSPLTRARASGSHYSSAGNYPFVAGVDGVGKLDDGSRVYFVLPRGPHGAMAEQTVVRDGQYLLLPDGLDDVTAAAIANPGMSSWTAFTERARLRAGETVLVNGATGASGQLAVQIAKYMGAAKVIATGRNAEALAALPALGADVVIPLLDDADAMEASFKEQFAERVDVVIDYLWGNSAERILIAGAKAGAEAVPIRFVQVGTASGADIRLPGAILRSSAIELLGSGIGSVSLTRLVAAVDGVLRAAIPGGFKIDAEAVSLSDVERAWSRDDARIVFTVE